MKGEKEYGNVVSLEETVDPPLHVLRRLLCWDEIELVYNHNHGLVVNQLVQIGNDTPLENEAERGHYRKVHDVTHV